MTTLHARAAHKLARTFQQTDEGRQILATYRGMVDDPEGVGYTRAIAQPYSGWNEGQVAAFARVHHLIASGKVRVLVVPVGAKPSGDGARQTNQQKLTGGLPAEFTADVYEGLSHDGDALLGWAPDTEVPFGWTDSASLEIGYTDASRTLLHLFEAGIVARWPYHSEDVWLFGFAEEAGWHDFIGVDKLDEMFAGIAARFTHTDEETTA